MAKIYPQISDVNNHFVKILLSTVPSLVKISAFADRVEVAFSLESHAQRVYAAFSLLVIEDKVKQVQVEICHNTIIFY